MSNELTVAVTHPEVEGIVICQWLTGSIYEYTLADGRTVAHDSETGLTVVRCRKESCSTATRAVEVDGN